MWSNRCGSSSVTTRSFYGTSGMTKAWLVVLQHQDMPRFCVLPHIKLLCWVGHQNNATNFACSCQHCVQAKVRRRIGCLLASFAQRERCRWTLCIELAQYILSSHLPFLSVLCTRLGRTFKFLFYTGKFYKNRRYIPISLQNGSPKGIKKKKTQNLLY